MTNKIDHTERARLDQERKETLQRIAPEVCSLLGEGWQVASKGALDGDSLPQYVDLRGPNGENILVSAGSSWDKTSSVSGHFDDRLDGYQFWYLPYKTERPSINVNILRGAKAVASEIQRRILPAYLPLFQACEEARARHIFRRATGLAATKALAEVIGADWRENGRADGTFEVNTYRSHGLKGTFFDVNVKGAGPEANDGPTVTFDRVTVPVEVGAKILALLADNHKPNEEA